MDSLITELNLCFIENSKLFADCDYIDFLLVFTEPTQTNTNNENIK